MRWLRTAAAVGLCAGLSACDCGGKATHSFSSLAVSPLSIDFGSADGGSTESAPVTLTNSGSAVINFTSFNITGDTRHAFSVGATPTTLAGSSSVTVTVTYSAPAAAGSDGALLVIDSDAQNAPEVDVSLSGQTRACTPESDTGFCARLGDNCGSVTAPDNCGSPRTVSSCGTCTLPQTCGGGGSVSVCGCPAESDLAFCADAGAQCGSLSGTDNCGVPRLVLSCGACNGLGVTCGGGDGGVNQCGCTPESDTAFCADAGANCGALGGSDNCGGFRSVASCGVCTGTGQSCGGGDGGAHQCGCTPESDSQFCTNAGANCGTLMGTDNCGLSRTVASCGPCTGTGQSCGGGGVANVCGCTPVSDAVFCANASAQCGAVSGVDNCGSSRFVASCPPGCTAPQTCGGAGVPNQCGCTPVSDAVLCADAGAQCGALTAVDNCGGNRTVNACPPGCTAPAVCGAGDAGPNQCSCVSESDSTFCADAGAQCGSVSGTDNCGAGRTVSNCGACLAPQSCAGNGAANVCQLSKLSKVLVAVGSSGGLYPASAEVWDPVTGNWTSTNTIPNSPPASAGGFCAAVMTLLGTGQAILTGGGCADGDGTTNAASIYDPVANKWDAGPGMNYGRDRAGIATLPDGTALVFGGCAGGCSGPNILGQTAGTVDPSAEIYNPATNAWSVTGSLSPGRAGLSDSNEAQSVIRLADGAVLACNGNDAFSTSYGTCTIYSLPPTASWAATGSIGEPGAHPFALLASGKVLTVMNNGSTTELFDPSSGTWTATGSLPSVQISPKLVALANGKVLACGGVSSGGASLPTAALYTPANGTWASTTSMNVARSFPGTALLGDGRVLVTGGNASGGTALSTAELYDPVAATWTNTSSMSAARFDPNVTLLAGPSCTPTLSPASLPSGRNQTAAATGPDGRIYVFGGANDSNVTLSDVLAYDPCANTWALVGTMPIANFNMAAATGPDGRIYVLGGEGPSVTLNNAYAYDPVANTWTTLAPMITARANFVAAAGPDGRIYALGGVTGPPFGPTAASEAYDIATNTWTSIAPMSVARLQHGGVTGPDGRLYVMGGNNYSCGVYNSLEAYNTSTNTWTTLAAMPIFHDKLASALGPDGKIYAITGAPSGCNQNDTGEADAYDYLTNTWGTVASIPTPRESFSAVTGPGNGGLIYAIGGGGFNAPPIANVSAYSSASNTW